MPRPPLLPTVDWKMIFDGGKSFADWLDGAEDAERAARMQAKYDGQHISATVAGALQGLTKKVYVIAIAEDWCGDVIRHAPVLQKLADASGGQVEVRYIARADHLDVFARYLTNGGEAIPKFIFVSADWVETGNWGPMPEQCRELISQGKAIGDTGKARKITGALYAADAGCQIVVDELANRILIAGTDDLIVPE